MIHRDTELVGNAKFLLDIKTRTSVIPVVAGILLDTKLKYKNNEYKITL